MVDTNQQTLQRAAQRTFNLDLQGAARKVTGLKRDLNGICKSLWGQEAGESFDDLLMLVGNHNYRSIFGGSLSTPDHASFAISTIDARWMGEYRTPNVSMQMIGQWVPAPNASWVMSIHPNKRMRFAVSSDGTALEGNEADADVPFGEKKVYWMRQTFENVGGNRVRTHYWAPATLTGVPTVWTQIGTPIVQVGNITPFNSTGVMGAHWVIDPTQRFYAAEVRNGIGGTVVCNPDIRGLPAGTTSFQDGTGKTWTVGGFGTII